MQIWRASSCSPLSANLQNKKRIASAVLLVGVLVAISFALEGCTFLPAADFRCSITLGGGVVSEELEVEVRDPDPDPPAAGPRGSARGPQLGSQEPHSACVSGEPIFLIQQNQESESKTR